MPLANRNTLRNPTLGSFIYGFTSGSINTPGARKDSLFLLFDLLGMIFPTETLSVNNYKYISPGTSGIDENTEGYFSIYRNETNVEIRINKANIDAVDNSADIIEFLNSDEATRIIFRDDEAQIIGYYFISLADEDANHIVLEVNEIAYENTVSTFQDESIYSIELGYVSAEGRYVNTSLAPETIGGFPAGEPITPPEGLTQKEFNDKLFSNITLPIVTFNVTNETIEKGETYNKNITITFTQNDAGALIEYLLEIDGTPVAVTDPQPTVFTDLGLDNITLQAFASHALSASLQANTISTSLITITRRLKIWYDAVAVLPTDSAEVRALGNDVFDNANTVTLNTGTTNNKFTIAVPTSVNNSASLSAQDITNNVSYTYDFIEAFNVSLPNGAGTEEYRIYALQVDNPFPSNAQHVITI